jgi:hypothetical protein
MANPFHFLGIDNPYALTYHPVVHSGVKWEIIHAAR